MSIFKIIEFEYRADLWVEGDDIKIKTKDSGIITTFEIIEENPNKLFAHIKAAYTAAGKNKISGWDLRTVFRNLGAIASFICGNSYQILLTYDGFLLCRLIEITESDSADDDEEGDEDIDVKHYGLYFNSSNYFKGV